MVALLFLVSHDSTALSSMHYWPPKTESQRKGSQHFLVRPALLKYLLQHTMVYFLYVMVKFRFRLIETQTLLCLGKDPSLTGCNQNDVVSWHAAIACTSFELSRHCHNSLNCIYTNT